MNSIRYFDRVLLKMYRVTMDAALDLCARENREMLGKRSRFLVFHSLRNSERQSRSREDIGDVTIMPHFRKRALQRLISNEHYA